MHYKTSRRALLARRSRELLVRMRERDFYLYAITTVQI